MTWRSPRSSAIGSFSRFRPFVWLGAVGDALRPASLSTTILHELSHRLDNTDDEQYCGPARYCEDLSTRDAIDNADSYARFAQEIFNIWL